MKPIIFRTYIPHKAYNTILRNPKTVQQFRAGTAALCPGATGQ